MLQIARSAGITGLHQMGYHEDYLDLVETGQPSLRIWYGLSWQGSADTPPAQAVQRILEQRERIAQRVAATGKPAELGPLLAIGYVKLMNDGVLSARTAVLLDDYGDRAGWRGEYITDPAALAAQVRQLNAAGLPVAIHSIGDAAVRIREVLATTDLTGITMKHFHDWSEPS